MQRSPKMSRPTASLVVTVVEFPAPVHDINELSTVPSGKLDSGKSTSTADPPTVPTPESAFPPLNSGGYCTDPSGSKKCTLAILPLSNGDHPGKPSSSLTTIVAVELAAGKVKSTASSASDFVTVMAPASARFAAAITVSKYACPA